MEHPPKKKVTTLHKIDFFSLNTPTRSNPASVLAAFKFYNIDLSSCQDFFYSLPSNTLHESRLAASDACLGGTPLSLSLWQPLLSWLIHLFLLISHPLTWAISPYQCHSLVQTTSDLIQISFKKEAKERAWWLCVKHRWLQKIHKWNYMCFGVKISTYLHGESLWWEICEKTYLCYYFTCHLL